MRRESVTVLTVVLALVLIGILMVYSTSAVKVPHDTAPSRGVPTLSAGQSGATPPAKPEKEKVPDRWLVDFAGVGLLWHQLAYVALGLCCMAIMVRFDYHHFGKPAVYRTLVLLALASLVLVLFPGIGVKLNNARRWIQVAGFRFQPSEFAKIALLVILAVKLSTNQDEIKSFRYGFFPAIGLTALFAALVYFENDLGVPVVMVAVAFVMVFVAGTRWSYVLASMVMASGFVAVIAYTTPYRLRRFKVFLDPWPYAQKEGLQLIQGLAAFARGSLLGQGLGASQQKLSYLPYSFSDFIFAIWGEEMGLVGTLLTVVLYSTLLYAAVRIARGARDLFGTMLAAGIIGLISIEAALNMGVTTGLLPTKGLPLPFISYGGSALVVNLILVGMLINIGLQAEGLGKKRRYAAK